MIETRKEPAAGPSRPGRWLLKLLASLQPARSPGRRLLAGLALLALLALFAALGYGVPALFAAYGAP